MSAIWQTFHLTKGQRGRKRKESASEAPLPTNKAARVSEESVRGSNPVTTWRVSVARMYYEIIWSLECGGRYGSGLLHRLGVLSAEDANILGLAHVLRMRASTHPH